MEQVSTAETEVSWNNLNHDITFSEVKDSVMRAKAKKATGTDTIPSEVLKNSVCINMLLKIISYCFKYGIVPSEWQKGTILPLYKEGDKSDPSNYRGITLLNSCCKIYCDVLNTRLTKYLETTNKLRDEQNGFRPNRSCQDHIYSLYSIIKSRLSQKLNTYACFVDARKAFDRVNRECLWYKLQCIGVTGKMYSAIKSLYSDVTCYVKLNGTHITKPFNVFQGVKQGCKLSPALFSIYVNDLACELDRINKGISFGQNTTSMLMFADDIVLLSESETGLQAQLNCLNTWCSKWRLDLNLKKTKVVHFRKKQVLQTTYRFKFGKENIMIIDRYKYLGLWFEEHLDLSLTVREVAKSASRALSGIIAKYNKIGGMSYSCFTKLYESIVQPVIMYGAPIWGTSEHKIINSVQNRACRFFLGVCEKSPNLATVGDMGWLLTKTKQHVEVLRYWLRLRSLDENRLTYKIFRWSFRMGNLFNKWNYERCVKKLWIRLHCTEFNVTDVPTNPKQMICTFKQYLHQQDGIKWYNDLWNDKSKTNGNKLRTYRLFKTNLNVENYTMLTIPKYKRKYFAMLRAGSLPLRVETGRYSHPPVPLSDRKCTLCNTNMVEDEMHFLINCELYSDIRDYLFDLVDCKMQNFRSLSPREKFNFLMSSEDIGYYTIIAVYKMFSRRKCFV
jgi:hypothetical protein